MSSQRACLRIVLISHAIEITALAQPETRSRHKGAFLARRRARDRRDAAVGARSRYPELHHKKNMPRPRRRQLLLAALATLVRADRLQDEGVELRIAAKQTRCVYEELPEGVGGTLEVFVLSGGGEMDIDVAVDGPMKIDQASGLPAKNGRPAARVTVKSGGVN